jgi:hypothetical protein
MPRRESCGVLVCDADIVAMCEKDIGDSPMLLEKILETPDVARQIDEQIALAAPDEVRMRSVHGGGTMMARSFFKREKFGAAGIGWIAAGSW